MAGRTPLAAIAIVAVWLIVGEAILEKQGGLQCNFSGMGMRFGAVRQKSFRSTRRCGKHRGYTPRKCGGEEEFPEESSVAIVYGRDGRTPITAAEIVPLLASFITLGAFAANTIEPYQIRARERRQNSLPLTWVMKKIEQQLDKIVPSRVQKIKSERQAAIGCVGLVAPLVGATMAQRQANNDYSYSFQTRQPFKLIVGSVYEAKDDSKNWWPMIVESRNSDGTYRCQLTGANWESEPVWDSVWVGNCREVINTAALPAHLVEKVGKL